MENSMMNEPEGANEPGDSPAEDSGEKTLDINLPEYPDLEGIKVGAPVDIRCKGTVGSIDGDNATLNLDECDVTTEGQADKDLKDLSAQDDDVPAGGGADKGYPGGGY